MTRRSFLLENIINLMGEAKVFLSQGENLEATCRRRAICLSRCAPRTGGLLW